MVKHSNEKEHRNFENSNCRMNYSFSINHKEYTANDRVNNKDISEAVRSLGGQSHVCPCSVNGSEIVQSKKHPNPKNCSGRTAKQLLIAVIYTKQSSNLGLQLVLNHPIQCYGYPYSPPKKNGEPKQIGTQVSQAHYNSSTTKKCGMNQWIRNNPE